MTSTLQNYETLYLYPRVVFDSAIVGVGKRPGDLCPIVLYGYEQCVAAVRYWFELTEIEAHAYVTSQCEGSWLGPGTPIIMKRTVTGAA